MPIERYNNPEYRAYRAMEECPQPLKKRPRNELELDNKALKAKVRKLQKEVRYLIKLADVIVDGVVEGDKAKIREEFRERRDVRW